MTEISSKPINPTSYNSKTSKNPTYRKCMIYCNSKYKLSLSPSKTYTFPLNYPEQVSATSTL